jgi:hypothetical protein
MGANATTFVPSYTSGEVLTAANLSVTNSGIPVFAGTVERDAAFGGTGEKTLAEGQFAYIEATNTTQYYDGATWQSVGVAPGLVCVKAETAFSAVANVTADGVFTSAYTNYKVIIRYTLSSGQLAVQLRAATVDATSNYNTQYIAAGSTSVSGQRSTSQSSALIANNTDGAFTSLAIVEISGPQLAEATNLISQSLRNDGAYTNIAIQDYYSNHSTATSYDGIKILGTSANITGSYTIYGYSKTV